MTGSARSPRPAPFRNRDGRPNQAAGAPLEGKCAPPPRDSSIAAPAEPGGRAKREPGRETVLVLEEEPAVRKLVRQMLESRGYAVLETAGVEDAYRALEAHAASVDVVIAETLVPGRSCPKFVKQLRATRPDIALVLMSGVDDREHRESEFGPGIPFISKPFTVRGFIEAVQAAMAARPRR